MVSYKPRTFALGNVGEIDAVRAVFHIGLRSRNWKKSYHATDSGKIDVSLCERYAGILDTTSAAGDHQKREKRATSFLARSSARKAKLGPGHRGGQTMNDRAQHGGLSGK